jgi:hypothetical protein
VLLWLWADWGRSTLEGPCAEQLDRFLTRAVGALAGGQATPSPPPSQPSTQVGVQHMWTRWLAATPSLPPLTAIGAHSPPAPPCFVSTRQPSAPSSRRAPPAVASPPSASRAWRFESLVRALRCLSSESHYAQALLTKKLLHPPNTPTHAPSPGK